MFCTIVQGVNNPFTSCCAVFYDSVSTDYLSGMTTACKQK